MRSPQYWLLLLCLSLAALSVYTRGDVDRVPPSSPLAQFPPLLGNWRGEDLPISNEVLDILGKGDFLNRQYQPPSAAPASSAARNGALPVQLFIAYFATQRSGQSIHSPQNCLPGSGWTFVHSGVTQFTDSQNRLFRVGEYLISNGREKQEVLYWYQSHGRSIASDYMAKLLMLTDSIRLGRTDAALVRVITPVSPNENESVAHDRAIHFATLVTPLLPGFVPD